MGHSSTLPPPPPMTAGVPRAEVSPFASPDKGFVPAQYGRGHIPQLDGVRGLAILLVMAFHFAGLLRQELSASSSGVLHALQQACSVGWAGVDLFFVLSGFLITGILLDTKRSANFFSSFYARRTLRIFPLYYGVLVAGVILAPALAPAASGKLQFLRDNQAWLWSYLTNWLVARQGDFNKVTAGFLWSLAVEEQFYLVWPLLAYLLSPRALGRVCVAILVAGLPLRLALHAIGATPSALYVMTFTHLDPLAVGGLLAVAVRDPYAGPATLRRIKGLAWLSPAALLAVLAAAGGECEFWNPRIAVFAFTPLAFLFGGLLLVALRPSGQSVATRLFGSGPLRSFGRYSYAIYLFHFAVAHAVKAKVLDPSRYEPGTAGFLAAAGGFLALAVGGSWAAGWLSWHLYEKHFLRLKRFFRANVESGAAKPPGLPFGVAVAKA